MNWHYVIWETIYHFLSFIGVAAAYYISKFYVNWNRHERGQIDNEGVIKKIWVFTKPILATIIISNSIAYLKESGKGEDMFNNDGMFNNMTFVYYLIIGIPALIGTYIGYISKDK